MAAAQTRIRGFDWALALRYLTPGVVFAAALPLGDWAAPTGWLTVTLALLLAQSLSPGPRFRRMRGALETMLSILYALASLYLLQSGNTVAEVFATTMLGVALFATLVRDYRHTRRLMLNLLPFIAVIVVVQALSVAAALQHRQPAMIATILGAPVLVGAMFMTLRRDLVSAHRRLSSAVAAAEAAARSEGEFLANMSHEIRTPLNAVIGFASLLEASAAVGGRDRSHVRSISIAGTGLLAVVDDILDWSRLEAGQIHPAPEPTHVESFLGDSLAMFDPLAASKALSLKLELDPGVPPRLVVDPARLRQVLTNLLSNALKFTTVGGVTVRAAYDAAGATFTIEVEDTGIGISPQQFDRLFQRFSQLDRSDSRRHGGSGLGLSISKRLAELMGGDISVSSTPSVGSTFRLAIKAAAAQTDAGCAAPTASEPVETAARDILVVDDLEANRRLLRLMLEAAGHRVTEAASGPDAVETAARRRFDLILMDLQMPGMDGATATALLRSSGSANASTAIIAVSADVLPEHVRASQAAGMDDHLAKPIRPSALVGMVERWGGVTVAHAIASRATGTLTRH